MYLGFFSLREAPFSITPDTDFFYPHMGAQTTLNTLLVALRNGEGFIKIVGELGCGKTVLCRQLLKTLQGEFVTAYIPNPDMGRGDLLLALADELGVKIVLPPLHYQLMHAIHACLLEHAQNNRRVLLCIDEAQAIPLQTVESLRLLSNLETEKRKLLQIVLLGQPDLDTKLAQPEIRQLLQRITFSEYLGPMQLQSVAHYLQYRLATAAVDVTVDTQIFSPQAAQAIAQATGGVPRLINILAHKCLMLAYGEGLHRVSAAHVALAVRDTPSIRPATFWQRNLAPVRLRWPRWSSAQQAPHAQPLHMQPLVSPQVQPAQAVQSTQGMQGEQIVPVAQIAQVAQTVQTAQIPQENMS